MLNSKRFSSALYLGSVLFSIVWLTYFLFKNTVPVDSGDGLMHYFIAQATWNDPIYFIDHWGKPLFSFFASPFAQFGLNGVVFFNILVFLLTCLVGQKMMNKLNTPVGLQLLFPLILLVANDYSMTILAGLTEPFFNLLIVTSGLLLLNKKWFWFAIILSFLPFARSEGQLPLILGLVILIYTKQFKIIPFLGLGFLVYAIIGFGIKGDFWWYFTDSPYSMDNGVYGKGTWDHYLTSYRNYIGNPGLYVLMLGVPLSIYFLIKRKWDFLQFDLAFFAYGVFLGIVVLHSYFWATGQNGSLGLTRIATQGMPLFLLLNLSYIGRLNWTKNNYVLLIFCVAGIFLGRALVKTIKYPNYPNAIEVHLAKAKNFLLPFLKNDRKVYYSFPYFGYLLNENQFISSENSHSKHYYFLDLNKSYKKGDFILWDSHFGPKEAGAPIELIAKHKEFVLVKEFVFGNESIRIYQFVPLKDQIPVGKNVWKSLPNNAVKILKMNEFTDVFPEIGKDSLLRELELVFYSSSQDVDIVFDNGIKEDYCSNRIEPNDSLVLKFQVPPQGESKLYIWNPKKIEAKVSLKNYRIRQVKYPKVI